MKTATRLLLILSTLAATIFGDDQCFKHNYKCATENSECSGDFVTQVSKCYNETTQKHTGGCCQYPYHCINKKCVLDNAGAECESDSDCLSSYYGVGLLCIKAEGDEKGKCAYRYSAGDKCGSNADCYGNMTCEKGTCKGIVEGEKCIPPVKIETDVLSSVVGFMCVTGTYCSNDTCVGKAKKGDSCNDDVEDFEYKPCLEGLVCNNFKCIERYSLKIDDECTNDKACASGNPCINGKCSIGVDYHFMKCNNDSDCKVGNTQGVCSPCNPHTGHRQCYFGEPTDCAKAYINYHNCIQKNGCADIISLDSKSCARSKCKDQINNILGCKMNCKDYRNVYGTCASYKLIGFCPVMAKWAQTLLAFVILIVVLALVCIGYTLIERFTNKGYAEIPDAPDH